MKDFQSELNDLLANPKQIVPVFDIGDSPIRKNSSAVALRKGSSASSGGDSRLAALLGTLNKVLLRLQGPTKLPNLQQAFQDICASPTSFESKEDSLFSALFQLIVYNETRPGQLQLENGHTINAHFNRYDHDFKEISQLGKGAFGHVYKASSNVDQCLYAIKKIKLGKDASPQTVLAEVLMMAKLDHPNIVRYHNAWIEVHPERSFNRRRRRSSSRTDQCQIVEIESDVSTDSSGDESSDSDSTLPDKVVLNKEESESYNPSFGVSNAVVPVGSKFFGNTGSTVDEDDEDLQVQSTSFIDCKEKLQDEVHSNVLQEPDKISHIGELIAQLRTAHSFNIFIQMELCSQTLTQFLTHRNSNIQGKELSEQQFAETLEFAINLMSAIDYLHQKSVIHRDVKPSNIFMVSCGDCRFRLKLGDFGLACYDPLQDSFALQALQSEWLGHSRGVGTVMYAAPEQSKTRDYNTLADIYSCGLVLIEMFSVLHTDMERADLLSHARQGVVPEHLDRMSPNLFGLIVMMLLQTPNFRPSAAAALKHLEELYKEPHNDEICAGVTRKLQEENNLLRAKIEILEEQMALSFRHKHFHNECPF